MKLSDISVLLAIAPFVFMPPAFADTMPALPPQPALAQPASPAPAPAFEQVLAHVYENNPQLQAERESVKILDEKLSQANAGLRPTLSATGEIGQARVSEDNQDWRYGVDKDLGLIAIQPIYNGATFGQRDAAKSRILAGRAHLLATEQTVLLAVITAWLDMCEKYKLFDLAQDNLALTRNLTDATRQRFKAGDTTQTDVAVAESRLAEAGARHALAESAFNLSRIAFERASGLPPQVADFPKLPLDLPRSSAEAGELASQNPAVAQAQYELEATQNDIDTADDARLPYIYLRGSMTDEHALDLGLERLRTDTITINASLPLYQGGAEYSKVREAKLLHEKSRMEQSTTSLTAIEQAQQAWNNFRTAQLVIDASYRASESGRNALAGIKEEYSRGTRTLTELLDAQNQMLNTQTNEIQAQKNLHLEAYKLLAADGRLTAQGLNLPTRIYDPTKHYDDVADRWFGTDIETADK